MEWIVPPEESGIKLQAFLVKRMEGYSAKALKRAIETNCCQINDRTERFASTIVGRGDHIKLEMKERSLIAFEKRSILFEDQDLFVYNKPAGINCDEEGIVKLLDAYDNQLQLVHRLDRDTTGALIFAKSDEVLENLIEQFRQHQVKKSYKTIVDGIVQKKSGVIDNYLVKKRKLTGQTIWGESKTPSGLHAITHWECLKQGKEVSLIECHPKTGRTHQLRVHMAGMGHPILGDHQYGKKFKTSYHADRYLLHADKIEFKHPQSMKAVIVQAPLADDFLQAEQKLHLR